MSTMAVDEKAKGGTNAKTTRVKIMASAAPAPDHVAFEMKADFEKGGGSQDKQELKFDHKAGPFVIEFDLLDKSGLNLAFLPTVAEAIYVGVGGDCPTVPGNGGGAITPGSVTATKLTVNNANAVAATLGFTLRFSGDRTDASHPPYVYDPKIINGGDGPPIEGDAPDCA